MTTTLKAKLENGMFRPLQPVDWPEGAEVIITRQDETAPHIFPADPPDPEAVAAAWAEIAAQAVNTGVIENVSENHDKYLYGELYGA